MTRHQKVQLELYTEKGNKDHETKPSLPTILPPSFPFHPIPSFRSASSQLFVPLPKALARRDSDWDEEESSEVEEHTHFLRAALYSLHFSFFFKRGGMNAGGAGRVGAGYRLAPKLGELSTTVLSLWRQDGRFQLTTAASRNAGTHHRVARFPHRDDGRGWQWVMETRIFHVSPFDATTASDRGDAAAYATPPPRRAGRVA